MFDPPGDRAYLLDMPTPTKTAKPFADLDAALDLLCADELCSTVETATDEIRTKRIRAIYDHDEGTEYRCSHQNPYIKKVYEEFLETPGSPKAHQLLHTHYEERPLFLK